MPDRAGVRGGHDEIIAGAATAAAATTGPQRPAVAPGAVPRWFARILVVVLAVVLGFGAVGLVLAMLGWCRPVVVFPLGALAAAALARLGWHTGPGDRSPAARTWTVLAVLVIAATTAVNAANAGEHVVVNRDPGVYLVTGRWVAEHGSLVVAAAEGPFATADDLVFQSPGTYDEGGGHLQFQFSHLVPVLLAEAHWVGGDGLARQVPVVLGAAALLASYALAARLAGRHSAGLHRRRAPRVVPSDRRRRTRHLLRAADVAAARRWPLGLHARCGWAAAGHGPPRRARPRRSRRCPRRRHRLPRADPGARGAADAGARRTWRRAHQAYGGLLPGRPGARHRDRRGRPGRPESRVPPGPPRRDVHALGGPRAVRGRGRRAPADGGPSPPDHRGRLAGAPLGRLADAGCHRWRHRRRRGGPAAVVRATSGRGGAVQPALRVHRRHAGRRGRARGTRPSLRRALRPVAGLVPGPAGRRSGDRRRGDRRPSRRAWAADTDRRPVARPRRRDAPVPVAAEHHTRPRVGLTTVRARRPASCRHAGRGHRHRPD